MTTEETLWIYQNRDVVEKCFDDCKNELDLQRLRINSTEVMDAKLLIHFFALIILSKIRKTKRSSTNLQKLSAKEILSKLETISLIKYSGHYGKIYSDVGVAQREILTVFDVKTPT
jgi:transposase